MAMRLRYASLSLGAAVDQQTGNLSVFDLLEEIRAPQVPFYLQSMVIAISLENASLEEVTGTAILHHINSEGSQQHLGTSEIKIPEDRKRVKAVFRFGGFPIHGFGTHRMQLDFMDGERKVDSAVFDFEVIQSTQTGRGVTPSESEDESERIVKH